MGVESVIRQNGAVPATVAVLDGMLCVGMLTWTFHFEIQICYCNSSCVLCVTVKKFDYPEIVLHFINVS
jgi:hypothetical protein